MNRRRLALRLCATTIAATLLAASAGGPASALTLGNTGSGRPALALAGARMYIAWAGSSGTAAAKQLVVGYSTSAGLRITKVPGTERVPQGEGAALDTDGTGVYVAWPAGDNGNTLTAAYTTGSALTCRTAFTGIVTAHAPALASDPAGVRHLAWTGPDGHLNVARLNTAACAAGGALTLTNRVVLADTSVAGPALVYDDSGSSNLGLVLAWAAGDGAHSVQIGSFTGSAVLGHRSQVTAAVGSTAAPGLSSATADLYVTFRGDNGSVFYGYSEGCIPTCFHASDLGEQAGAGVGQPADGDYHYYTYFDPTGHLVVSRL
ncbi:hypothetical protein [Catellatospora citrea]|uniref:Uncharacterized protein n=1 Tax=Catellatospora citrea TaxID=53366 RepID=A0A8J3KJH6_9ACTN|nr:hypothetical protein [Catellatospora citrea]RKE05232.1 hypothetical protein C8E86_0024 [Catellatospora citrea]GIF98160.1 hypothetical protein Cci01nite_32540 [Catellatospora citrea]